MSESDCEVCRLEGLCEEHSERTMLRLFLNDLTQLSLRYKLVISGCGCCGSPSIDTENDHGHYVYTDKVEWKKSDPPTPMVNHPLRHLYCGTDDVCFMCNQPFDKHQ